MSGDSTSSDVSSQDHLGESVNFRKNRLRLCKKASENRAKLSALQSINGDVDLNETAEFKDARAGASVSSLAFTRLRARNKSTRFKENVATDRLVLDRGEGVSEREDGTAAIDVGSPEPFVIGSSNGCDKRSSVNAGVTAGPSVLVYDIGAGSSDLRDAECGAGIAGGASGNGEGRESDVVDETCSRDDRDSDVKLKKCPMCLVKMVAAELRPHLSTCIKQFHRNSYDTGDSGGGGETGNADEVKCEVCAKPLKHMNAAGRRHHVNRCIDRVEKEETDKVEEEKELERMKMAVLDCPMCGKPLKTQNSRKSHMNRCARDNAVSRAQMIELVRRQRDERDLLVAAGVCFPAASRTRGKPKRKGTTKRLPVDGDSADLQLAVALSTSLMEEQERLGMTDCQAGIAPPPRDPQKKSRKNKPHSEAIPALLLSTPKSLNVATHNRVSKVIAKTATPGNRAATPPFFRSKFARARDETVNNQASRQLWVLSAQTAAELDAATRRRQYYVTELMPPVEPSSGPARRRGRRLSAIPGRRRSDEITRKTERAVVDGPRPDAPRPDGPRPDGPRPDGEPALSQTTDILAQLAAEGNLEPTAFAGGGPAADAEHATGFFHDDRCSDRPTPLITDATTTTLATDLATLINDPTFSDITIATRDPSEVIASHKAILAARCPSLKQTDDFLGWDVFSTYSRCTVMAVLVYVYTGNVPDVSASDIADIGQLAAKLGLDQLVQRCGGERDRSDAVSQEAARFHYDDEEGVPATDVVNVEDNVDEIIEDEEMDEVYEYLATQKTLGTAAVGCSMHGQQRGGSYIDGSGGDDRSNPIVGDCSREFGARQFVDVESATYLDDKGGFECYGQLVTDCQLETDDCFMTNGQSEINEELEMGGHSYMRDPLEKAGHLETNDELRKDGQIEKSGLFEIDRDLEMVGELEMVDELEIDHPLEKDDQLEKDPSSCIRMSKRNEECCDMLEMRKESSFSDLFLDASAADGEKYGNATVSFLGNPIMSGDADGDLGGCNDKDLGTKRMKLESAEKRILSECESVCGARDFSQATDGVLRNCVKVDDVSLTDAEVTADNSWVIPATPRKDGSLSTDAFSYFHKSNHSVRTSRFGSSRDALMFELPENRGVKNCHSGIDSSKSHAEELGLQDRLASEVPHIESGKASNVGSCRANDNNLTTDLGVPGTNLPTISASILGDNKCYVGRVASEEDLGKDAGKKRCVLEDVGNSRANKETAPLECRDIEEIFRTERVNLVVNNGIDSVEGNCVSSMYMSTPCGSHNKRQSLLLSPVVPNKSVVIGSLPDVRSSREVSIIEIDDSYDDADDRDNDEAPHLDHGAASEGFSCRDDGRGKVTSGVRNQSGSERNDLETLTSDKKLRIAEGSSRDAAAKRKREKSTPNDDTVGKCFKLDRGRSLNFDSRLRNTDDDAGNASVNENVETVDLATADSPSNTSEPYSMNASINQSVGGDVWEGFDDCDYADYGYENSFGAERAPSITPVADRILTNEDHTEIANPPANLDPMNSDSFTGVISIRDKRPGTERGAVHPNNIYNNITDDRNGCDELVEGHCRLAQSVNDYDVGDDELFDHDVDGLLEMSRKDTLGARQTVTPVQRMPAEARKGKRKEWVPPSPFTPMLQYNAMSTPQLKRELHKFGVKPLGKKRMMTLLEQIYQETHQYETDSEFEASFTALTEPRQKTASVESREGVAGESAESSTDSDREVMEESYMLEIMDSVPPSTQSLAGTQDTGDVHDQLLKFFKTHPAVCDRVLMYEALELDWLRDEVKKAGVKCSAAKLIGFMDEKCIAFTMKSSKTGVSQSRHVRKNKNAARL